MSQSGFLLLNLPFKFALESIGNHLLIASKHVQKLYIKLNPPPGNTDLKSLSSIIPSLYAKASSICKTLDVRVILNFDKRLSIYSEVKHPIHVIFTTSDETKSNIQKYIDNLLKESMNCNFDIVRLPVSSSSVESSFSIPNNFNTYDSVVLGGTFDRLHNGHKVLLSIAALRANKKLTVGVTDGAMLKRKFLWEMIEPIEKRINDVIEFLIDVNPSIEYSIVPIYDVFGPAINPDMDFIVVSQETKRGGDLVNEERQKQSLKPLEMLVVELVEDLHRDAYDEVKLSSSNTRRSLLGMYIKSPAIIPPNVKPVIALISGLLHDNDSFLYEIQKMNANIIDCVALLFENENFLEIMKTVEDRNINTIDKKSIYYSILKDKNKQKSLASLSSNLIQSLVEAEIAKLQKLDVSCIILKTSFCFQNDLLCKAHQVWGCMVPDKNRLEAIKQCFDVSDEEAEYFLANDSSNKEILDISNMVFCPVGEPSFLSLQIQRAWKELESKKWMPSHI